MNKNQYGFSAVELLLAVVFIGLIAGVAYYVGSNGKAKPQQNLTSSAEDKKTSTKSNEIFKDKAGLYSFELPKNWIAEYLGEDKGFLTLKPQDFKAPGDENNWVVQVFVTDLPGSYVGGTQFSSFSEFKKITLEQSADPKRVTEDLTINGASVWKYNETFEDSSPTGPPELSGGYQDLSYNYNHTAKNKIIGLRIRTFQHATTNYQGTKINESYDNTLYKTQFEAIAKSFKLN